MTIAKLIFILSIFFAACNGMPSKESSLPTLRELAASAEDFEIFRELLAFTNLTETFFALEDVTIFAPPDRAFILSGREACEEEIKTNAEFLDCAREFSTETISNVLLYHVVPKVLPFKSLIKRKVFKTLQGSRFIRRNLELIDLAAGFDNPFLESRDLDIFFDVGVVHVIDRVLIPFVNVIPSDPCRLLENPLITVLSGNKRFVFVSKESIFGAPKKCKGFVEAIKECETENVCKEDVAMKMLPGGVTIGDVVAAAATCKKAAAFVARCAGTKAKM